MRKRIGRSRAVWVIVGILIGMVLAGQWLDTPARAVATDRGTGFVVATGRLDENIEGLYVLDLTTGDLSGVMLNRQTITFSNRYTYNVLKDFEGATDPQFTMVTGLADLRRGPTGQIQPSDAVIYVAELTTGRVVAYSVPWSRSAQSAGKPFQGDFVRLDYTKFRAGGP